MNSKLILTSGARPSGRFTIRPVSDPQSFPTTICPRAVKRHKCRAPSLSCALALAFLSIINSQPSTCSAQGTAFTYQGRLNDGANPATGIYDLRFAIYDSPASGTQQGVLATNAATAVSNGLFTVALDFGNQFPGANRWLEIAVRTNGNGSFFTLSPRQALTPSPYAITAGSVVSGGITGTYGNAVTFNNANNHFSGAFTGNGANVTNVNAATLGGLSESGFWKSAGNAGTTAGANFIGTTDNQPLEFRVNGGRGLRIEPGNATNGAPNIIGGSPNNSIASGVVGAFIGGGESNTIAINAHHATIGGGHGNMASGPGAFVGGGGTDGTLFFGNTASNGASTVSGGMGNTANNSYATVGGGAGNKATGINSTIGGGEFNSATGYSPTVSGGYGNTASSDGAVSGGEDNTASDAAAVGGGQNNSASSLAATVSGGIANTASGPYSTVGGGLLNIASGQNATVPGGINNTAAGIQSFAAGTYAQANHDGTFVWADSQSVNFGSTASNQFLIRASGGVGIGLNNPAAQLHVASAAGNPQVQITQNNASDYTRLRMRVASFPSWEMDVSPGATPGISWWTGSIKMNLDFNGNLTTVGTVNGSSDRNVKEHFSPVSAREVLEKVSSLPITEWNYITDGETLRHIGPMAQDFYAAFNVGTDDKHISMVDADGVALAAIQGLNKKVESENAALRAENAELNERLKNLERLITSKIENAK